MGLPLVAIVGAPNVGKSTLFNRLVGGRRAIVGNEPGVTRDRLYGEVALEGRTFRLVDTGGLTTDEEVPYARQIERQASVALDEASVLLFVVDARVGATALDRELAATLRRRNQPQVLVANKSDARVAENELPELWGLGLGEPVPISAEHGHGVDELLERVRALLPETADTDRQGEDPVLRVAIIKDDGVARTIGASMYDAVVRFDE